MEQGYRLVRHGDELRRETIFILDGSYYILESEEVAENELE
jgi:hypothetical protein